MKYDSDTAVTSVMGEMLVMVLVLILVSLFATSAFNLLPGDREQVVTVSMETNDTHLIFWHKGGDWVDKYDLTVTITPEDGGEKITHDQNNMTVLDFRGNKSEVFDLGGNITIAAPTETGFYEVRMTTPKSVIYNGRFPE